MNDKCLLCKHKITSFHCLNSGYVLSEKEYCDITKTKQYCNGEYFKSPDTIEIEIE